MYGPIAAFDLHNRQEADVFLGPICDYVLAPVARYANVWNRPVLTTGGLAAAFNYKVIPVSFAPTRENRFLRSQGHLHTRQPQTEQTHNSLIDFVRDGVHVFPLATRNL